MAKLRSDIPMSAGPIPALPTIKVPKDFYEMLAAKSRLRDEVLNIFNCSEALLLNGKIRYQH